MRTSGLASIQRHGHRVPAFTRVYRGAVASLGQHCFRMIAFFFLLYPLSTFARSGPQHLSFRPMSMGNAFVAVVDDKDALFYNPAGLNLINALGNPKRRPGMSYPRDRMDLRMDVIGLTSPNLSDLLDFKNIYNNHQNSFSDQNTFLNDSTLQTDLTPFDRKPIHVGVLHGSEFAMHNFGFAYWADATVAPYADQGILLPQAGVERIQIDAVIQLAGARGFMNDKLSVGVGYRLANRQQVENYQLAASDFGNDNLKHSVIDTLNGKLENYGNPLSYGHGIDVGALWQQYSWLRFGAAVQNMGMYLNGDPVTPEFTVGAAATPAILQHGGIFGRKVNFAVDLEDLFNNDHNYKPLNKINFGAEVEQYLWWIASVRLASGFKGGYWTGGLGLSLFKSIHVDAVTWAEEKGYYTGQTEDRYFAINVGLGI